MPLKTIRRLLQGLGRKLRVVDSLFSRSVVNETDRRHTGPHQNEQAEQEVWYAHDQLRQAKLGSSIGKETKSIREIEPIS